MSQISDISVKVSVSQNREAGVWGIFQGVTETALFSLHLVSSASFSVLL